MNKNLFDLFGQICQVPRPSKHEEQMSQWLVDFANQHGIACEQDAALNVLMRVPATPGYENREGVILQAHMDMVCEKNNGVEHDFMRDPIQTYIDGDWMKARGTTLGGDDGMGVAMALAILTDPTLSHPALEALFTVDEEQGMTGAMALQPNVLKGRRLLNLDSEDEGLIFIGCAGGLDTTGYMHYTPATFGSEADSLFAFRMTVSGLLGGHSGDNINMGRACALKLLVNFLHHIEAFSPRLVSLSGGTLRNAIARDGEAVFAVSVADKHEVVAQFNLYQAEVEKAFGQVESTLTMTLDSCPLPQQYVPTDKAALLIRALYECPHGMIAMSKDMPGLVETSTNLASVRMQDGCVEICTSQRSSVERAKQDIKKRVHDALAIACDEVTYGDGYPGWTPNVNSPLVKVAARTYEEMFATQPQVLAVHAGLECGLFAEKYPDMDMISIGPQMHEIHSPQEMLSISSSDRCYDWVCYMLSVL